ncbi:hypothetical protein [uncultured Devosia sp.]|uniref:hypothetical protein n=1 Tax=uncultured Devosia sp. TaxID=211434 RepID=UPI0035C964A8
MMRYAKIPRAALLAVLLLLPVGTMAQEPSDQPPLSEADGGLVLDRLGYRLNLPMPDWLENASGPIDGQVGIRTQTDDRQALLEIRPKGETEALWTTLYGARIILATDRPLPQFRAATMADYAATCQPAQTGFFQLEPDQGDVLPPLGFVCGAYRDDLSGYAGLGEVAVMSFKKHAGGFVVVFQQWRGAAFDPKVPASWPVATDIVQARANQLQAQTALAVLD